MREEMTICLAHKDQAEIVKEIVDRTIRKVYPKPELFTA